MKLTFTGTGIYNYNNTVFTNASLMGNILTQGIWITHIPEDGRVNITVNDYTICIDVHTMKINDDIKKITFAGLGTNDFTTKIPSEVSLTGDFFSDNIRITHLPEEKKVYITVAKESICVNADSLIITTEN